LELYGNKKKHIIEMKKIVLVALVLLSTNFSFAQFAKKDPNGIGLFSNPSSKDSYDPDPRSVNRSDNPLQQNEVRSTPPLTPATLLLLGLGGCAVGATVYRNTRKEK
jgi:hypothetical protein